MTHYLIGGIKDHMNDDQTDLQSKRSRYETVYKKDSLFSDVVTHLIAFIILGIAFKYFLLDQGVFTYVIGFLA